MCKNRDPPCIRRWIYILYLSIWNTRSWVARLRVLNGGWNLFPVSMPSLQPRIYSFPKQKKTTTAGMINRYIRFYIKNRLRLFMPVIGRQSQPPLVRKLNNVILIAPFNHPSHFYLMILPRFIYTYTFIRVYILPRRCGALISRLEPVFYT